jgi:hypothetical protein
MLVLDVITTLMGDLAKQKNACVKLNTTDKKHMDIVMSCYDKSKAPLKAIVAAGIAKIAFPEWDIREHQMQIGGLYSLRSVDTRYIASEIYKLGLYDTPTSFALTRSFEKAECYDMNYSGKISPIKVKKPFLTIIQVINSSKTKNKQIMLYVLRWLVQKKSALDDMKAMKRYPSIAGVTTLESINESIEHLLSLGSGSSVVPVIITHACCSIVFRDIFMKPLKYHTAADKSTNSLGDIEGYYLKHPKLVIEVKYNMAITETMILTFDKKSASVPMRLILTTKNTVSRIHCNDILVGSVREFCIGKLQEMFLRDVNVYAKFVRLLRVNLINSPDLSNAIKSVIKL